MMKGQMNGEKPQEIQINPFALVAILIYAGRHKNWPVFDRSW
jgi:hypothetical protein